MQKKDPISSQSFLYGIHAVRAALLNPRRQPKRLLITHDSLLDRIEYMKSPHALRPELVDKKTLEKIVGIQAVHQGVCLYTPALKQPFLEEILHQKPRRLAVLDQVTDPHNVGAILRSAAVFGVGGVIIPQVHGPLQTPVLAKAASGALETVPLVSVVNLARALDLLKKEGFWCLGLDAQGRQDVTQLKTYDRLALIFGAEGDGLRPLTRSHCDAMVSIPAADGFSSLNVSNAAAIAFFAAGL